MTDTVNRLHEPTASSTFGNGDFKSRQNKWWVSLEHTLHKNFLMLGQPIIEELLSSKLGDLVHYEEQVVSISEHEKGVDIVTSSDRRVRSRYAVGADGARSTVRSQTGASFAGTKPEMIWAVLDTFIDTDFPVCPEIITFEVKGQSRVSWIPRERGLSRFYVLLDGEVTQERAQESIKRHVAPYHIEFRQTEWYSTFEGSSHLGVYSECSHALTVYGSAVKERIASSFISQEGCGRIFLAGDAAHVHSVNGGQGLNTGIADAFGLAWRLAVAVTSASTLTADARGRLLLSYDIERRGTAQGVVDVAAALVRDTVHEAKRYVGTIEKNAGYITGESAPLHVLLCPSRANVPRYSFHDIGMGVSYAGFDSPLVWESKHGIWTAGCRCPDLVLQSVDGGKSTRIYSEATYGKFMVLFLGIHAGIDLGHRNIAVSYRIYPLDKPAFPNGPAGPRADGPETTEVQGSKTFRADWTSWDDSLAIVVRPDMYVGYVGQDAQSCRVFLDEIYT